MAVRKKAPKRKTAMRARRKKADAITLVDIKAMEADYKRLSKDITSAYDKAIRLTTKAIPSDKRATESLMKQQKRARDKLKVLKGKYKQRPTSATKREITNFKKAIEKLTDSIQQSRLAQTRAQTELSTLRVAAKISASLMKVVDKTRARLEKEAAKPKKRRPFKPKASPSAPEVPVSDNDSEELDLV